MTTKTVRKALPANVESDLIQKVKELTHELEQSRQKYDWLLASYNHAVQERDSYEQQVLKERNADRDQMLAERHKLCSALKHKEEKTRKLITLLHMYFTEELKR